MLHFEGAVGPKAQVANPSHENNLSEGQHSADSRDGILSQPRRCPQAEGPWRLETDDSFVLIVGWYWGVSGWFVRSGYVSPPGVIFLRRLLGREVLLFLSVMMATAVVGRFKLCSFGSYGWGVSGDRRSVVSDRIPLFLGPSESYIFEPLIAEMSPPHTG